jgi:membrane dipeptidase
MQKEKVAERDAIEKAKRIHAENIVIDTLAPRFISEWLLTPPMIELAKNLQTEGKKRSAIKAALTEYLIEHCATDAETREAYLAYWQRSGVTACSTTMYNSGPPDSAWDSALAEFGRAGQMLRTLGGALIQAGSAADIEYAHKEGRYAVIYNLQNAEPFGDKLERVDTLYGLGLRVVQLTYNLRNRFAEGGLEKNDGGLSRFGEALIDKLNRRRILVDTSHCSDLTVIDAAAVSSVPIAVTHTASRSISGHPRAKPDHLLKAVVDKGGYIGVLILPAYLLPAEGDGRAEKAGKPLGWATLDTVVDHIVYFINLVGSDSVGIGTDWGKPYYNVLDWSANMVNEPSSGFDWVGWRPENRFDPNMQVLGMETWDKWHNLTAAMLRRGIAEETVIKIVGGNFLRIFREVCG